MRVCDVVSFVHGSRASIRDRDAEVECYLMSQFETWDFVMSLGTVYRVTEQEVTHIPNTQAGSLVIVDIAG